MRNRVRADALRPLAIVKGRAVQQSPAMVPLVSVIIPNYNYARFLPDAVLSALAQWKVLVEVIVVDDASTDDSLAIARAFADRDPRVLVIARGVNGGPVATFNDGLAAANGEYLVRLDADDILTPGSLARATALAEAFPEVGLVYGRPVHFEGTPDRAYRDDAKSWVVWPGADWLELRCRLGVNCITSPEVLMRASVVREVGGQRQLAHTHDMEMWLRLARAADVGWVAGADQAWHREHSDSLSAREVDVMRDLEERAAAFRLLLTDGHGDAEENARLLRLALSALANEALTRTTQAYSAGRGESVETEEYLAYAKSLHADLDDLPQVKLLNSAERLGRRRAPLSPNLFVHAVLHRLSLLMEGRRWRTTGL